MKAIITGTRDTINTSHLKGKKLKERYVAINSKLEIIVECRIYETANTMYCGLWILNGDKGLSSGSHKGSYESDSYAIEQAYWGIGIHMVDEITNKEVIIGGQCNHILNEAIEAIAKEYTEPGEAFKVFKFLN